MSSNYTDVLGQLRAFGLLVRELTVGRMQRCRTETGGREKNGWYVLHEVRMDSGDDLLVGSFGIWQGNENNAQKVEIRRRDELSAQQREAIRKRIEQDQRRAKLEAKRMAERAAERARKAWEQCGRESPAGGHDYLLRKGVQAHGLRYSPQGALVIPMLDGGGRVHGLQIIRSKAAAQDGKHPEKEYWPAGLTKRGMYHLIGMPMDGGVLLVAEGYATAASLHEATGLPVAVAFDANNLLPVAQALAKRYKLVKLLICADDDSPQKCHHTEVDAQTGKRSETCKQRIWLPDGGSCPHCGNAHNAKNAGVQAASAAALAVGGAWIAPQFAAPERVRQLWLDKEQKLTDFNDLQHQDGAHAVSAQIRARLLELNWGGQPHRAPAPQHRGEGRVALKPFESLSELIDRFALVYEHGDSVFDHVEHALIPLKAMRNACISSELHRAWMEHPERKIVRVCEVDFDPTGKAPGVLCNLWAGWPTKPSTNGDCSTLLELLAHMCRNEADSRGLYDWIIKWLAYPIQHPGAKMRSTIVVHGPQGTGKNMFFETVLAIYGQYGRILDQSALEDKFNDWASRKLFLIADEVVARSDLYHVKNKLKAFITGDRIRINPKNMAAYEERNHVNMVFLSNENMPVVLEEDDRRHAVVWTPGKLDHGFYAQLKWEIENGGIEALHHHLLHINLGDFTEGTMPPMTDAKRSLIRTSMDNLRTFFDCFMRGEIPGFPAASSAGGARLPALTQDFYELYRTWCTKTGEKVLSQKRLIDELVRHRGLQAGDSMRKRYYDGPVKLGPHGMVSHASAPSMPEGVSEPNWLGERIDAFRHGLREYKGLL